MRPVTNSLIKSMLKTSLAFAKSETPEVVLEEKKDEFYDKVCTEMNDMLSESKYFCGKSVSLIDILIYCDADMVIKLCKPRKLDTYRHI